MRQSEEREQGKEGKRRKEKEGKGIKKGGENKKMKKIYAKARTMEANDSFKCLLFLEQVYI